MPNWDFGGVGSAILKKTAGSGAFTNAAQVSIPFAQVNPTHPDNVLYPRMGNVSQNLSVAFQGNYTPAVTLRSYFKPSWFTLNLLKSLILQVDGTTLATDQWAMQIKSQYRTRKFSKGRCTGVRILQQPFQVNQQPTPIIVDIGMIFCYGDHGGAPQDPSPPTFSAAATDAGQLTHKGQIVWTGADQVRGMDLAMTREQGYVFEDDGTLNAVDIATGFFGGGLALPQSSTFTTTPSSTVTVAIGAAAAGVQFVCALNRDSLYIPQDAGFVMSMTGYTLASLSDGAIPVVATAL